MLQRFQSFVTGVTQCYKSIQKIKATEMTEFGLKGTHVMCLFFLSQHPEGLTAAQLSQMCAEDKAAISRTLSVLQEKGYIQAGEKKYRAPLRLTPAGQALAREMEALIQQWVSLGGDDLTEEERRVFYRVLGKIAANLGEQMEHNL
ncbi:MAG: winged helix-turn-helix transcriptional regulator [Ruminiclostridium sp.]|nr:winged helix-turn-helix transcriptional regulator [Ruminiclostridium sp.]